MNAPVSFGLMERLIQRRAPGANPFFLTNTASGTTVHVMGDVDRSNVFDFELEIRNAAQHLVRVSVDLTFCTYFDLAVIRTLGRYREELGERFGLIRPQRLGLCNILKLAGV